MTDIKPTPPPNMTVEQQKAWDYAASLIPNQGESGNIEERVAELEKIIENHQHIGNDGSSFLMDTFKTKANKDYLADELFEIIWSKYFIWTTFFESIDGWAETTEGGGGNKSLDTGIKLETDNSADSGIEATMRIEDVSISSFDKEQRILAEVQFDTDNVVAHIGIGCLLNCAEAENFIGFRFINVLSTTSRILEGVMINDGEETVKNLKELESGTSDVMSLEIKIIPSNKRIVFIVDGVVLGIVSATLPTSIYANPILKIKTFDDDIKTMEDWYFSRAIRK